jgi:hypothetical protein
MYSQGEAASPCPWFSASVVLKTSGGDIGVAEHDLSVTMSLRFTCIKTKTNGLYMLEGEVTFQSEANHFGGAGAFVLFPRGIPHTVTIESPTRFLLMNTRGGFERCSNSGQKTVEDAERALNSYEVEVVGPRPRQAGRFSFNRFHTPWHRYWPFVLPSPAGSRHVASNGSLSTRPS